MWVGLYLLTTKKIPILKGIFKTPIALVLIINVPFSIITVNHISIVVLLIFSPFLRGGTYYQK